MYAAERKVQGLSALAAGIIVIALALALILGLKVRPLVERAQTVVAVALSLDEPPPPPEPERPRPETEQAAPKGDPAPRNLRNSATQIVAPKPPVQLKPPPPITTTPVANTGDAADNGASDLPGPGQGAGGIGDGFGGGGLGGTGPGDGAGGPPVEPPRKLRGRLSYRDLPEGLLPEGREGHVEVIYMVQPDGRVTGCQIERSSGIPGLDGLVCNLIEQRFVFRPARDRNRRPVRSFIGETHSFFGRPERG